MSNYIILLFFLINFILLTFISWFPLSVCMLSLEWRHLPLLWWGGDYSLPRLMCQCSTANYGNSHSCNSHTWCFGGLISTPLPACLFACLQVLARECKLPSQSSSLAGCGGKSSPCSHSSISAGKRGEYSYRPPPGLRAILVSEMK